MSFCCEWCTPESRREVAQARTAAELTRLRARLAEAESVIYAIGRLHEPQVIQPVMIMDMPDAHSIREITEAPGEWREIDPDSAEGIYLRDQIDVECGTQKECNTRKAIEAYRAEGRWSR